MSKNVTPQDVIKKRTVPCTKPKRPVEIECVFRIIVDNCYDMYLYCHLLCATSDNTGCNDQRKEGFRVKRILKIILPVFLLCALSSLTWATGEEEFWHSIEAGDYQKAAKQQCWEGIPLSITWPCASKMSLIMRSLIFILIATRKTAPLES